MDYYDTDAHLINFSVLNVSGCERGHQQPALGLKCKSICRREPALSRCLDCLSVLGRDIVCVRTSEVTVMKECDDSDTAMCMQTRAELLLQRIH